MSPARRFAFLLTAIALSASGLFAQQPTQARRDDNTLGLRLTVVPEVKPRPVSVIVVFWVLLLRAGVMPVSRISGAEAVRV